MGGDRVSATRESKVEINVVKDIRAFPCFLQKKVTLLQLLNAKSPFGQVLMFFKYFYIFSSISSMWISRVQWVHNYFWPLLHDAQKLPIIQQSLKWILLIMPVISRLYRYGVCPMGFRMTSTDSKLKWRQTRDSSMGGKIQDVGSWE